MEKIEALEKLTLRLSHMADGVDSEVDAVLVSIRSELKNGASAAKLKKLSTELARALMSNTGVNADVAPSIEGGFDLSGLRKLIKSMPVRGEAQQRMSDLVQKVASGTTTIARQKALVDLLGVAGDAVREATGRDKSENGMLGWLGKKSGSPDGDERYVTLFAQLLQRSVEHIDVMNGSEAESQPIKDALSRIVVPEQARHLLDEVTSEIEAIDTRIRAERNQTTDFLGDLRDRISGFEEVLELLTVEGDSSVQRSENLQTAVGADTLELGEAAKSDDIVQVRSVIDEGLQRITSRLAKHVSAEREQNEASKVRVTELNDRLANLEAEADVLRSEIRTKNDLVMKDSLTGVYNRAGYEDRAIELFSRWERAGAPLSLVFVDCNKFKEINDNYGHAAGDLVLVKVAEVLRTRARASDFVCRYGGDEFVIMLPDTDLKGAEVFARSACDEVLAAGFNDNGKPLDVSISCGVTEFLTNDTLETAMGRADEAMYRAKAMNGVKVCASV
ncbi:MAG: GGDEF domain-containing protein [Congregibacter sp.]